MSTASPTESAGLKTQLENLIDEWDAQVKEFRRLSLNAEGYTEVTRMRAKADTLNYARNELMNILEESHIEAEASKESFNWPGLSGIVNSGF